MLRRIILLLHSDYSQFQHTEFKSDFSLPQIFRNPYRMHFGGNVHFVLGQARTAPDR